MSFIEYGTVKKSTWQALERVISRLLMYEGFENVRLVGGSGDKGADLLASKYGKRWLFQAKQWKTPVSDNVLQETINAANYYSAKIPVIVASNGFTTEAYSYQRVLQSQGIPLQLWDENELIRRCNSLADTTLNTKEPRPYQENAIREIVSSFIRSETNRAFIVLATGLGKTFVAAESFRRIQMISSIRVLVLAHTNALVSQLERAFWPFLRPAEMTLVWNGYEHPDVSQLRSAKMVFACIDTVYDAIIQGIDISFDAIIVDECHHAGSPTYRKVLDFYDAGKKDGPFLLGMTATPWRPDEVDLKTIFGEPLITIDMIYGMKNGFLSNVDYRIHTDNTNWSNLKTLNGKVISPRQINRVLFINQWDDAVVDELHKAWIEQTNPRAIVFCGTIDHAITMRDKINAIGFCNAQAIFTSSSNTQEQISLFERNKILSDFADGIINVICTVDVFNEGIDVPDVNILVFQRVTHSRRIFIQQLGRGLRISDDKEKVIVLDFVADIRRYAAGIDLKNKLNLPRGSRIDLPNKITFKRSGKDDPKAESFLEKWLEDVAAIEAADDGDSSVLKFPNLDDLNALEQY